MTRLSVACTAESDVGREDGRKETWDVKPVLETSK